MASDKFKIVFNTGKEPLLDQSLTDIVQFRLDGVHDPKTFKILPMEEPKTPRKKKSEHEYSDQSRGDFLKSLSELQKDDILMGRRKICFSEEQGYYLRVIHNDNAPFYSAKLPENRRKHEIKEQITKCVILDKERIAGFVRGKLGGLNVTDQEVFDILKHVTFIIK